jgi:hypothetical protein
MAERPEAAGREEAALGERERREEAGKTEDKAGGRVKRGIKREMSCVWERMK